jgi:hypothetical protein
MLNVQPNPQGHWAEKKMADEVGEVPSTFKTVVGYDSSSSHSGVWPTFPRLQPFSDRSRSSCAEVRVTNQST